MSQNFLDQLIEQFSGPVIGMISQYLGINREQTTMALSQILPILTKALANNASQTEGASALHTALEKDHDGSILENLSSFLMNFMVGDGSGILKHVLGNQASLVARFVSQNTGLSPAVVASLMQVAAPIVMGLLGKERKKQEMSAHDVAGVLQTTSKDVEKTDPINMGMIGRLLDSDKDGSVMDDVAQMGMYFLKSWLNGRGTALH